MAMPGADGTVSTAENYRRFATQEAAGRSPSYEALALGVAGDEEVLAFLDQLPAAQGHADKRQPNLLFAAARHLLGDVPDIEDLRSLVVGRGDELASVMTQRRTQTNEPGRCATLLPALARILPQISSPGRRPLPPTAAAGCRRARGRSRISSGSFRSGPSTWSAPTAC